MQGARTRSVVLVLLLATIVTTASARERAEGSTAIRAARGPLFAAHRVLVGIDGPASVARNSVVARGGRIVEVQGAGRMLVVHVPGDPPGWARRLRSMPGVRYAEPDLLVERSQTIPNDPMWSSQWDMQAIRAPAAWDLTTGSPGAVVGVLDTGIDLTHPDLRDRLWTNPGEIPANGVDDEHDGWIDDVHGVDCAADDGDPIDDDGHGTHVAGTIGAAGNDGVGIAGVGWNIRLMALDIFKPNGTAAVSDITQCVDYAIAHGIRVTNNSWGGATFSQAEYDAFVRARNAGILMVAAAGNTGWNVDTTPLYPAAFDLDNVISVGASQSDDALVSWSCYGPTSVDIAAPGVGILSTWPTYLYAPGYWAMDGTSMASPHVAGVAALILSAVPGATYPFLRQAILSSAEPVAALAGKVATGGRLDASAALTSALTTSGIGAIAPTPSLHGGTTVLATGTNIDLRWSATDPKAVVAYALQRSTDAGSSFTTLALTPVTATTWRQWATVNSPSYTFRVRATDTSGASSDWATAAAFRLRYVQETAPAIVYAGSWTTSLLNGALGGSVRSASAAGATATASLAAGTQAFGVVFARTPGSGKVEVWLDGSKRATFDLYAASVQPRWLAFGASVDPLTAHAVMVKVLGQKRPASGGLAVLLDAVATLSP
jgi:subtilisin family serine protease